MTDFWAERAWLPSGLTDGVRMTVTDGRFDSIETGVPAQAGDRRLTGLVLPGLANGHSHAFHRALRGRTQVDGGTFWSWRKAMYAAARRLDPDRYLRLVTAVYAEMALAGYTVVGEFHYLHHDQLGRHYAEPNAMGLALIEGARRAGLRLTLLDVCYLSGGLEADGHQPLDDVQLRFGDETAERWRERVADLMDGPGHRIGVAAHSVRAVPAEELPVVAEAAAGRPLHVHLSEQPAENAATQEFYGMSPTVLLADHGLLGPTTTAVHATHLDPADVALLGRSRTFACFCPTTERDLADGIGPARALADSGSPLCVGSDQHAVLDPFEEVRGLELNERLLSGRRGRFTPTELLSAATANGYAALGWSDGGRIVTGALADFVAVRTDTVRTAGSRPEQILYSATAADVHVVVVGGELTVDDGRHRLGDVATMITSALDELNLTELSASEPDWRSS